MIYLIEIRECNFIERHNLKYPEGVVFAQTLNYNLKRNEYSSITNKRSRSETLNY